jgi:hypothetical protein
MAFHHVAVCQGHPDVTAQVLTYLQSRPASAPAKPATGSKPAATK